MKRSEAVDIIEEIIRLNNQTLEFGGTYTVANLILYALEQNGMKPPLEENCPVLFSTKHVWAKEEDEGPKDNI